MKNYTLPCGCSRIRGNRRWCSEHRSSQKPTIGERSLVSLRRAEKKLTRRPRQAEPQVSDWE